jgi:4-amino-4-deoxy-L-arabinose transferase-like glycosyltransferase
VKPRGFLPTTAVALLAGLIASPWTALTLAEFGAFTPVVPLAAFPLAASAVFRFLRPRLARGESPGTAPEDLAAVGIALASLLLTIPPGEPLLGGWDPGVYVQTAAAVSRSGSLLLDQPDLAALGAEERGLLFRTLGDVGMPFQGMFLLTDGRLSPQFYHLYPCLMAVAWSIGGIRAALLVNPLFNVAAVLALYALAALFLGRRWALAAALVHALAPAQIWQAKFPTAEMTTQFFLLAGVALLASAIQEEDSPTLLAALAGSSLGMAMLARYDTVLFLVPLVAVLLWGVERKARQTRTVLLAVGTAGAFWAQSYLHQQAITPYYQPLGGLVGSALMATALVLVVRLLLGGTDVWRHCGDSFRRGETALRVGAAAILCSWALFGWLVRPQLAGEGRVGQLFRRFAGEPPLTKIAELLSGSESGNMLYLVDLLGALGFLAALTGIATLLVIRRQRWETAWLAASAAVMVTFTMNVFHDHFLMWVSRRFVPVVLPLTSVGIAAGAALAAGAFRSRRPVRALPGAALVAAVLLLNADATRAMAREREWPGLIRWFESLDLALPRDAELYCDQPGFAAAARFIHGRRAYELSTPTPARRERLKALMRRRAAAGATVLYLSQQRIDDPRAEGLTPLSAHPLASSILETPKRGIPLGTRGRGADFHLYRVQAPS